MYIELFISCELFVSLGRYSRKRVQSFECSLTDCWNNGWWICKKFVRMISNDDDTDCFYLKKESKREEPVSWE